MKNLFHNKREGGRGHRKKQHLLDVKIRADIARGQRNRVLLYWSWMIVLMVGALGGLIYGAHEGLRRYVWENPECKVKVIEVTDDGGTVTREQIIEASGVKLGESIFNVKTSKIRQKLLLNPQFEAAEVQWVFPNKIFITVTERQPVAWVATKHEESATSPGDSFLIDSHGFLFQCQNQIPAYFQLPVIYGVKNGVLEPGQSMESPEIKASLELIRLNNDDAVIHTRFQAIGIDVSKGYCLVVTDQTHARITFALDRLDWQLERLMTLLDHVEQEKRELQTVNLMVQRNIPVTFGEPQPTPTPSVIPPASKPEKNASKNSESAFKKSQTVRQKSTVPVNKSRGQNDQPVQEKLIRKALPVNFSNT